MNKVFEANLKPARRFYQKIELSLDLHLGVADKMSLLDYLMQGDYNCFNELWEDAINHLWERRHKSKRFEYLIEHKKKMELYWANIWKSSK